MVHHLFMVNLLRSEARLHSSVCFFKLEAEVNGGNQIQTFHYVSQ